METLKIAVVQGGACSEAEVSHVSAGGVAAALQEAGHLFGSITKDIDPESKHWTIKSNTTSKEK